MNVRFWTWGERIRKYSKVKTVFYLYIIAKPTNTCSITYHIIMYVCIRTVHIYVCMIWLKIIWGQTTHDLHSSIHIYIPYYFSYRYIFDKIQCQLFLCLDKGRKHNITLDFYVYQRRLDSVYSARTYIWYMYGEPWFSAA